MGNLVVGTDAIRLIDAIKQIRRNIKELQGRLKEANFSPNSEVLPKQNRIARNNFKVDYNTPSTKSAEFN